LKKVRYEVPKNERKICKSDQERQHMRIYIYLGYGELLTYIHFPYFYYAYKFDDVTNVQSNGIYIISLLFFFSTFGRINVMYFPIKSYECLSKLSIHCSNIYFAMC
jgi:hypothetical protein